MKLRRNRIVIDLDKAHADQQGRARARRSGRASRILGIIVVVLVVVIMGAAASGYFWWRHFQSSPAYTLAVLADASQRKDTATVDSILDSEKITDDFVAQVRQRMTGSVVDSLWSSRVDSTLPSLTPKLRETVHDEIVKELQRLTEPAAGKPFILVALVIGRFADIKQENNTAHAQVNIRNEQLRLTMQSEGDHWRITAVQDDKLAKEIADGVMRNLPSKGAQLQDEIRKQMEKLQKREP
jgi:flagellar basal body-associated protein FliL